MDSKRLTELLDELELKYQDDWYVKGRIESRSLMPDSSISDIESGIKLYNQVLSFLDPDAWAGLKSKLENPFKQKEQIRGKENFFNILNEAFAYRNLVQSDYLSVKFVPEGKNNKTPDLSYESLGKEFYCEVTTIGMSHAMLDRYQNATHYDGWIHDFLDYFFLEKLHNTIEEKLAQVGAMGHGMVYIVAHFDDFSGRNDPTYQKQILQHLREFFPENEIYIQFRLQGGRHVHHKPGNGEAACNALDERAFLGRDFLNKLSSDILEVKETQGAERHDIHATFGDLHREHHSTYIKQILHHLRLHPPKKEVYIKTGIEGEVCMRYLDIEKKFHTTINGVYFEPWSVYTYRWHASLATSMPAGGV